MVGRYNYNYYTNKVLVTVIIIIIVIRIVIAFLKLVMDYYCVLGGADWP